MDSENVKRIKVKVRIDPKICINCGVCEALLPEVYEYDENMGVHQPKKEWQQVKEVTPEFFKKLKETEESCPVGAIKIEVIKDDKKAA